MPVMISKPGLPVAGTLTLSDGAVLPLVSVSVDVARPDGNPFDPATPAEWVADAVVCPDVGSVYGQGAARRRVVLRAEYDGAATYGNAMIDSVDVEGINGQPFVFLHLTGVGPLACSDAAGAPPKHEKPHALTREQRKSRMAKRVVTIVETRELVRTEDRLLAVLRERAYDATTTRPPRTEEDRTELIRTLEPEMLWTM